MWKSRPMCFKKQCDTCVTCDICIWYIYVFVYVFLLEIKILLKEICLKITLDHNDLLEVSPLLDAFLYLNIAIVCIIYPSSFVR